MIVTPKVRGFICTTAHPKGCAGHVKEQIAYVRSKPALKSGPKRVLVIGSSTGYGLASRITAAFASQAATVGIFFEKPAEGKRTATAGWYNTYAFDEEARKAGLYTGSICADAYSDEAKAQTLDLIAKDLKGIDLLVYSLAAPRRTHPKTGKISKSVLKPKQGTFTNKSIDLTNDQIVQVTLQSATEEEIIQTVDVMGGEDWQMWVDALDKAGLLAKGFKTVAYSYIGPDVTTPVYRNGTIGAAKEHLENTAHILDKRLKPNGGAFVSVNKALVTQSSSAIPFIPLYFVILMKVMKKKGLHEDCIQQIDRLFRERLYTDGAVPVDMEGRIRIDDLEMRSDVQAEVKVLWEKVNNENLKQLADLDGFHRDFMKLFGFGISGVNYNEDVDIDLPINLPVS